MTKMLIPVGHNGRCAEVDSSDYAELAKYQWHEHRVHGDLVYAYRYVRIDGRNSSISMHRQIVGAKKGELIDHKDRNGLNNIRENLRVCTQSENMRNCKRHKRNKSGFKGVTFVAQCPLRPWRATIRHYGVSVFLGNFATPEQAHAAYVAAASKLHGEFARPD